MHDLGSLIIVHLVEPAPVGTIFHRKRSEWPLHITLVPWFSVADSERTALLSDLREFAATTQPLTVRVGAEDKFGSDKVSVNLIVEQAPLRHLHNALLDRVQKHSIQFHHHASPESGVERPFRAHITHHTSVDGGIRRRFPGDSEGIKDISVARLLSDNGVEMCEIIATIPLGEYDETAT